MERLVNFATGGEQYTTSERRTSDASSHYLRPRASPLRDLLPISLEKSALVSPLVDNTSSALVFDWMNMPFSTIFIITGGTSKALRSPDA